ncbi:sulfotransferase 1B1-like [Mya arenaria]|uniref:sulfotransferase 1B1-like n=1 Tax=Mya arenaria TaxID=6604 RepID=UPI0022E85B96|nr:sulfotransferase 1B1-like [Mya arenaria]XP_052771476.1 sulfotransferase 1B1-like [Mya arenaria]
MCFDNYITLGLLILQLLSEVHFKRVDAILELPRPRTIKCHLPYRLLPTQILQGKGKIIYTSRNHKDVVQSYYSVFLWGDYLHDETTDGYVDAFVQGNVPIGLWTDHVLSYWTNRNCINILLLKYEDTVKDMSGCVRKIANFLDRKLTDDDVIRITENCDVNRMRENPMTSLQYMKKYTVMREGVGTFINKGKAGYWREVLTPEMSAKIDTMKKPLEGTGLQYDFQ